MKPDLTGFGDVRVLRPLQGGHRNSVWMVEVNGIRHVAKSSRRSEASVDWMSQLMRQARACGINTPHLLAAANGGKVVNGWTLETFVPGARARKADLSRVTSCIDHLHATTRHWPQRPEQVSPRDLAHLDQGGDIDLRVMPDRIVDLCRQAWSLIPWEPEVALHGDLTAANAIVTPQGVLTLIDWDESRKDAASFEAPKGGSSISQNARLAWEVACCWTIEPQRAKALAQRLDQIVNTQSNN